jgi:hypothetical protein
MKLKPQQRPRIATQARLKTVLIITGVTFAIAGIVGGILFFYLNVGLPTTAKAAPTNISGVINSYLRVTAISSKTFTADNLSGTIGDFAVGKTVMVFQAKGATITTTNTSSYGTVTALNNAGNYELSTVSAFSGTGPYTITVSNLSSSYTVSGAVQLISVPKYTDATVTGTISAVAWNATQGRGGVVAMQVTGTLSLGASVDVSGQGFTGGAAAGSSDACPDNTTFRSNSNNFGAKGEGASGDGNLYGIGAQANGGGGGNPHNAGGGGGSNHTTGGNGGQGYQPGGSCTNQNAGGRAGKAFSYSSMATKIFFGGGGGAGQQNNNVGSSGANGGGIIVIQAKTITSSCGSSYGFRANGQNAANSTGNDGAGGGGGGGSIVLDVLNYTPNCAMVVQANGGNGGSVTDAASHGGGAGGGVGIIEETHTTSNANVTLQSTVGTAGRDCSTCTTGTPTPASPPLSSRRSISAIPGGGTITLPVKLVAFTGKLVDRNIELDWMTASEENNDYFTIERSENGTDFDSIITVKGAGTSTEQLRYAEVDVSPILTAAVYYRLKQTDYNGAYEYSKVIRIDTEAMMPQDGLIMYPNPVSETLNVHSAQEGGLNVRIFNERGVAVSTKTTADQQLQIDVSAMNNGMYTVEITANGKRKVEKLIIRH